ncbi:Ldh family oxidoreductase [Polymorphum gilvum]|uniref:Malate/L-sulfolactate dehydrogenase multifunction enzyme, putative n=1 Tax=Polymorphum gilvum (strain LMG 25793 / CGMCC 1.9160 / SL003B-26A1) TaxID=991905 RepID=F2J5W7_POLGS|nr:Ldh family oxidoreductase [Polymorphum gilvum]ADZ71221.1 Malate/L-sulfolactate dehydrogenase multifunction enzyme, putative [Polymorphum gilvum SL003B-26A1]
MAETETLSLTQAHDLVVAALVANRTAPDNAACVARALVAAEADGQSGHGLSRVPSYAAQSRSGKVDGFARPALEDVTPALLRVDAGLGFAYPALDLALAVLPAKARALGIAIAAVRRSHHFGQAGAHCERLAEQGLVAFVFGNAPKSIAPWGGRTPLFGTNPIAFAAPVAASVDPGHAPLVIDLAVSRVAKGKIMAAEKAGRTIPEGWALDADGNPTTDASAAMAGTMIPIGEAKGAALAMMVEVMAAALVGASLAFEASSLFSGDGAPPNLGQTIIAIDPGLTSAGAYGERIAALVAAVETEPGARLPGSSRLAARARARAEGVAVPAPILAEIRALAACPNG